jgi:uncharacterized phiE125 gp8 family phage protein
VSWDRLTRVAAPAVAPLLLAAAKEHLRVDGSREDDLIQAAIDAAIGCVDGPRGIGVCMIEQTWRLSLDSFHSVDGRRVVEVPLGPVRSIDSVEYVDGLGATMTLDPSEYVVDLDADPARIVPAWGKCWPVHRCQPGAVKVTFKAGFGSTAAAVPASLVAALKLIVGDLYANREAVQIAPAMAVVVNPTVERLLSAYRVLF